MNGIYNKKKMGIKTRIERESGGRREWICYGEQREKERDELRRK